MTSVFKIDDDFVFTEAGTRLEQNYRLLSEEFAGYEIEFFYYIKPSEPERFFIIRIRRAEREQFINAAEAFAENMCFVMLNYKQAKDFLFRTEPLDGYN